MDGAAGRAERGPTARASAIERAVFEAFLFAEARLLDERRFRDWMALFAEDGTYWVPAVPDQNSPFNQVSLFYDDRDLMKTRVDRLEHPRIHIQTPPSRTAHLVGNVMIDDGRRRRRRICGELHRHHGGISRRPSAPLRRPADPQAAPGGEGFAHRAEAGQPGQLRFRVRRDGGADLAARRCRVGKAKPCPRDLSRHWTACARREERLCAPYALSRIPSNCPGFNRSHPLQRARSASAPGTAPADAPPWRPSFRDRGRAARRFCSAESLKPPA